MAKVLLDYKKAKLEEMMNYIEQYHPEDKEWFKKVAFVVVPAKTTREYVRDEEGNVVYILNKKGKEIPKVKIVPAKGCNTTKLQFSMLKAKKAFFEKYMPEAMPKKKEQAQTAIDKLMNW